MIPTPKPEFAMGDMGKCLLEKVERGEECISCKNNLQYGDDVYMYQCGHVVHVNCPPVYLGCSEQHVMDPRFTLRMLIVEPALPKHSRLGVRRIGPFRQPPSLSVTRLPILNNAFRSRYFPESSSAAAANAQPPQPPPLSQHQCCVCKDFIRSDRAIYRHMICNQILDFKCLNMHRLVCPSCGNAYGEALVRIDRDI